MHDSNVLCDRARLRVSNILMQIGYLKVIQHGNEFGCKVMGECIIWLVNCIMQKHSFGEWQVNYRTVVHPCCGRPGMHLRIAHTLGV